MNFSFVAFFQTYFPSLYLVQLSPTHFQLWDSQHIIWATIEKINNLKKEKIKITSLQQKSILIADNEQINEKELDFLEEINHLQTTFSQNSQPLLEQAQKDFLKRKKEIENQFRNSFSTQQKQDLQSIIQLLEEAGHSLFLLPEWIAIFEFWKTIYQKSNFKKSFFQRQEILKSLSNFYNNSQKEIPVSYVELESFINDFAQKNQIKEIEILLYGILNNFLNHNTTSFSKLDVVAILQEKIHQTKPQKIWLNNTIFLKSFEFTAEEQQKKTLFGTFESFADLLLAFSTQNETSQFGFEMKKNTSQVGIFGLSKNTELLNQLHTQTDYDLVVLDAEMQNIYSIKEISFFQSLSKKDKQLFNALQNAFKRLSKNGILFTTLSENQKDFLEKKSLAPLRRLLQEWFERIEIYENSSTTTLGIAFYKNTETTNLEKGIFYAEIKQNQPIIFQTTFLPSTWKPKPQVSEYQKLIPSITKKNEDKKGIFKTYFRAIPNQKIENFVQTNSELSNEIENNLKFKVNEFIREYNQAILAGEEKQQLKLEKKKNVLASKLATHTLFEKDILEKIKEKVEEKNDIKTDKEKLIWNEKNILETQISVFETGFWYYDKQIFSEFDYFYDLDKIFPNRKQGENILIFWANTNRGGEVWVTNKPVPSSFLNVILPNAYIFPLYIYEQVEGKKGKQLQKKSNFSKSALQKFRRGYAAAFEKRIQRVEEKLENWFDFSDFEFLQVHQEIAFELQTLSNLMNPEESKIAKEVKENLHKPKSTTYTHFEQLKKTFIDTKRTFERLENKATRNKESHDSLKNYFENGEKIIENIENYWQKLELEEAENFVVPTEENMTEKLILGYIFAVWQRAIFKEKYKEELKNEPPRIPIYKDFHYFANQGNERLEKFLIPSSVKIEFEIVELFEEKSTKKSKKIWFEKDHKIWYDKTTFLQSNIELNNEQLKKFELNQTSFLTLTLYYLRKNKIELQLGKEILENVVEFVIRFE